jgi:hypothetical protein
VRPNSMICFYKFPCHPIDMFAAQGVSVDGRSLRCMMIRQIVDLSQTHSQQTLDESVIIDVQDGEIVGMDTSFTLGLGFSFSISDSPVKLGQLSADNWMSMRL